MWHTVKFQVLFRFDMLKASIDSTWFAIYWQIKGNKDYSRDCWRDTYWNLKELFRGR